MPCREEAVCFLFLAFVLFFYSSLNFQKPEIRTAPNAPDNVGKLHSMKKFKRGFQEEEFCIGQRCLKDFKENSSNAEPFNYLVLMSVTGLLILLARGGGREEPSSATAAFRRALHSTSIRRPCPSLSPSPVPRQPPPLVHSVSDYRCRDGESTGYDEFSGVSPLPTTPPELRVSFSDVSSPSSFDLFPLAPPRRWRGNSKLHLATSPEVVPEG